MAEEQRSNLEMEIVKLYSIVTKTPLFVLKSPHLIGASPHIHFKG